MQITKKKVTKDLQHSAGVLSDIDIVRWLEELQPDVYSYKVVELSAVESSMYILHSIIN